MNPISHIIEALAGGASRSGDWVWAIDPPAFQRHIVSRASARPVQHSGERYIKRSGIGPTAVIPIHGVLMKDAFYEDEVSTPLVTQAMLMAGDDDAYESVLVDFDSPGGSCAALAELADAFDATASRKPVLMQCSGMMCSAAYYLAAPGQKIYAHRMDLVGSIGTRMQLYDFSKMFANLGIEPVTIDTGPLKSTGVMGAPVTDDQKQYLQGICDSYQQDFAARVMRGRNFTSEQFAAVATGAIFPATEALRFKLIDGIQSIDKTLAAMPRRQSTTTSQRSNPMSESAPVAAADQPVTTAQLKKALPNSTAEFRESQTDASATLSEALTAWAAHLTAENAKLATEKEAAEKRATDAEAKGKAAPSPAPKPAQVRGNKPVATAVAEGGSEAAPVDYYAMAKEYQDKHKCRWSEACLEIKKRHPESRAAFGAPSKE